MSVCLCSMTWLSIDVLGIYAGLKVVANTTAVHGNCYQVAVSHLSLVQDDDHAVPQP